MEKTIDIGGKQIRLKSTGATAVKYREQFNDDLIAQMLSISARSASGQMMTAEDMEALQRAAFIMAKQAGDTSASYSDWLDQFEMFDLITAMPQILELWGLNMETTEASKKK